ncbi:hypothetical protein IEO21_08730 [Rhodonia placenta]|uniref:Uncharacterized protein n=1 Tax=Rhodonia placenta TaxID=104341 RepID=A0A8H7NVS8_9APHY|nr:hypothetical protein IEO21_08730 [Postia placenta]
MIRLRRIARASRLLVGVGSITSDLPASSSTRAVSTLCAARPVSGEGGSAIDRAKSARPQCHTTVYDLPRHRRHCKTYLIEAPQTTRVMSSCFMLLIHILTLPVTQALLYFSMVQVGRSVQERDLTSVLLPNAIPTFVKIWPPRTRQTVPCAESNQPFNRKIGRETHNKAHTPIHTCSNMFYQTSAQRAMSVYDIVNEVISHFSPSREHSADLARLALVNLTFSDIAVKHLWEDVDIVHALRLFSGFEVVSADDPTYRISGDISANEWARFKKCATYVRRLEVDFGPSTSGAQVLKDLLDAHPEGPLFPQLRILRWRRGSPADTSAQHLISPTLRAFEFTGDHIGPESEDEGIKAILRTVFSTAGDSLQEMAIFRDIHPASLMPELWPASLRQVDLNCPFIDAGMITRLSRLRSLTRLSLVFGRINGPLRNISGFNALEKLYLCGNPMQVNQIMGCITSPVLHELEVSGCSQESSSEWRDCLATIASQFRSLRDFRCDLHLRWSDPSCASFGAFSKPLLALPLQNVDIVLVGSGVRLWSIGDLAVMARTWRDLRRFIFSWGHEAEPHARPILNPAAILEFIKRCPRLEALWLPKVDLRQKYLKDIPSVVSSSLVELDVEYWTHSEVEDPAYAAKWLHSIAPNLDLQAMGAMRCADWDEDSDVASEDADPVHDAGDDSDSECEAEDNHDREDGNEKDAQDVSNGDRHEADDDASKPDVADDDASTTEVDDDDADDASSTEVADEDESTWAAVLRHIAHLQKR